MSKYEIEIPDIEELKAVMQSHFENGRQEEAWAPQKWDTLGLFIFL